MDTKLLLLVLRENTASILHLMNLHKIKTLFSEKRTLLREYFLSILSRKTFKNQNLKEVYLYCEELNEAFPSLPFRLQVLFVISSILNLMSIYFIHTNDLWLHFITKILGRLTLLVFLSLVFVVKKNYLVKTLDKNGKTSSFNSVVLSLCLFKHLCQLVTVCCGIFFSFFIFYLIIYLREENELLRQSIKKTKEKQRVLDEILELIKEKEIKTTVKSGEE